MARGTCGPWHSTTSAPASTARRCGADELRGARQVLYAHEPRVMAERHERHLRALEVAEGDIARAQQREEVGAEDFGGVAAGAHTLVQIRLRPVAAHQ